MISNNFPVLSSTPIKEIVLSISFDGSVNKEEVDCYCSNEKIKHVFSEHDDSLSFSININNSGSIVSESNFTGRILKNKDETKVLHAKIGLFSLHIMNMYEPMESILNELEMLWSIFKQNTQDLVISEINVRYLNFIQIPNNAPIEDYLTIKTIHPFDADTTELLSQFRFTTQNTSVCVTCTKAEAETNVFGILLDNQFKKSIEDEVGVFSEFRMLHKLKNEVFFKSLTSKTIKIYQS